DKRRRRMCPVYVSGLIGPGDRKSIQPMAERVAPSGYDQLHHFVSAGVWDPAAVESELLVQADNPPSFRCMNVETGPLGPWDSEWFYHWLHGGWEWMEWVELLVRTPQQRDAVRAILKQIRFAGEETAEGFRVYGYIRTGQNVNYIE